MKRYETVVGVREFRQQLAPGTKRRWFAAKGIAAPEKRHHRDFRNAVAVCHHKIRYNFLAAVWDALRLGNHVYRCVICGHWHTTRQSRSENRRLHT